MGGTADNPTITLPVIAMKSCCVQPHEARRTRLRNLAALLVLFAVACLLAWLAT